MSRPSNFELQRLESRQLLSGTLTPKFTPVTITPAAISADSSLSNYKTFDLQVTITGTDDWLSGDLFVSLKTGSFYVPSGHSDQAQKNAWSGQHNLEFDTFVCGPGFNTLTVLGRFKGGAGAAIINNNTVDISWGDLVTTAAGTYTIARLTVTNDAVGSLNGRVGQFDAPTSPISFDSSVPLGTSGGQITGYVWNDLDADAGKDSGEVNIGGSHIYIDANNNGKQDTGEASVKARTNGNYTFSGLSAGTYRLRINPISGFRRSGPLPRFSWNVTLITGAAAAGKRFGITHRGQINGTVFNDGNGSGARDSGELGREGFTVWIDTDGDGVLDGNESSTITDSDGNFRFDRLDPGTYFLRCLNKKGFKRTTAAGVSVTLSNGQIVNGVLFGQKKVS